MEKLVNTYHDKHKKDEIP